VTVKKAIPKEQMNHEQDNKNIAQNNNHAHQQRYDRSIRHNPYENIRNDPYPQRGSSESKKINVQ
jgi:hypothetical protein